MYTEIIRRKAVAFPNSCGGLVSRRLRDNRRAFQGYFRRRLSKPQDAEDVFQDFVLKAVRSAQTLQNEGKVDAWLGCIMRNTLINHYRRAATRRNAEMAFGYEVETTANDAEDDHAEAGFACLYVALSNLKPDFATILRRADLAEEPRTRIAADFGLTVGTLNVRLHRARQALKAELESSCPACRAGLFLNCNCA